MLRHRTGVSLHPDRVKFISVGEAASYLYAVAPHEGQTVLDAATLTRRAFEQEQERTLMLFKAESGPDSYHPPYITYAEERVLTSPEFDRPYPERNWRDFIPAQVKACWGMFPPDARAGFYLMAIQQLEKEQQLMQEMNNLHGAIVAFRAEVEGMGK